MPLSRRQFVFASASAIASGYGTGCSQATQPIPGRILGANSALGHRFRDRTFPTPARQIRKQVLIIGGGIAGLAAGRHLARRGLQDFHILELESQVGGNSLSGSNEFTAFPWGAHYVTLPTTESPELRQLYQELGVITGYDAAGLPIYEETALCHDPMDRLFRYGRWQEGTIPQYGLLPAESEEVHRFLKRVEELRETRGSDGRRAFAIPVHRSSRDSQWLDLDQMSFAHWLDRQGFRSAPLRWYLNYCCRDDFGGGIERVSAWAGLHYFAARNGEASNAPTHAVLTWPDGNGWLVSQLSASLRDQLRPGSAAFRVSFTDHEVLVDCFDVASNQSVQYLADHLILAVPEFVSRRLLATDTHQGLVPIPESIRARVPWMVANLTLNSLPESPGSPLAWDNVLYDSPGLGYVVATHQSLASHPRQTVLTYYRPLDHLPPSEARAEAQSRTHSEWCQRVLSELSLPHPTLRDQLERLDVQIWGHGMTLPAPGFLQGLAKPPFSGLPSHLHFAHSDLSGISVFDEAYIHGIHAADETARAIGLHP